jgi:hypothetical protein
MPQPSPAEQVQSACSLAKRGHDARLLQIRTLPWMVPLTAAWRRSSQAEIANKTSELATITPVSSRLLLKDPRFCEALATPSAR